MRFVWAVVAFVLATLMIGAGIAQRTVLQGPKTETQKITVDESVPYILIDGSVLNSHDGAQTLRVEGEGTIFASYGRTTDMTAWLAPSDYVMVSLDDEGVVHDEMVAASLTGESAEEVELNPTESDLWLDQFQKDATLVTALELPDDMSMLIAADGEAPAPTNLSLTWPSGVTTPWAGPLIVGGAVVMAVGLLLYALGVRHLRRSRGPRRKGLPAGTTGPIDVAEEAGAKGVISATPRRRRLTRGRKALLAAPALGVSALLLAGCSADAWPQFTPSPTPTVTPTIVVPEGQGAPAVTQAQAERILAQVAATVADADAEDDSSLAATRLRGPALEVRQTNYEIREELDDHKTLAAIPADELKILLPEAFDGWPRTFLAVLEQSDDKSTVVMSLTQDSPWSDYHVGYQANMTADTELNVAPSYVGALAVAPDSPFLVLPPQEVSAAYADIVDKGEDSEFASLFDTVDDPLLAQIADDRAERLKAFNETGEETAKMTFDAKASDAAPVALGTLDSGAIVAVTMTESETVEATDADAVIKLNEEDNPNLVAQALTGVETARGLKTTYLDQLFFFVPAQSSNESIRLLGYSSAILEAEVTDE
ncbi:glycosyl transferase [Microbacterium sp.]|uniref:glycosyl transferase n=1 Tax=Microbacterium sp. TaxID=51671 RepID=UPI003A853CB0